MNETPRPSEVRLKDPLSEVTRNERRTLLGLSAVAIVMLRSGLVPSKISALGIEFDHADQRALLGVLALVIAYFLCAFLIYAASDLVAWRVALHNSSMDWARRRELLKEEERKVEEHLFRELYRGYMWSRVSGPMSLARATFEFAVPIVVGVYAAVRLMNAPIPTAARTARVVAGRPTPSAMVGSTPNETP